MWGRKTEKNLGRGKDTKYAFWGFLVGEEKPVRKKFQCGR